MKGAMDDLVATRRIDSAITPSGTRFPGELWYDTTTNTMKVLNTSGVWGVFGGAAAVVATPPSIVNLVTNGTFATDTSGWFSAQLEPSAISSVGGVGRVSNTTGPWGRQLQIISGLVVNESYIVTGKSRAVDGPSHVAISTDTVNGTGQHLAKTGDRYGASFETFSFEFVAPATQLAIVIGGAGSTIASVSEYDDISVKVFSVAVAAPLPAGWPLVATQPPASPPELVQNQKFDSGLTNWTIAYGPTDKIVVSDERAGGSALESGTETTQSVAPGILIPGSSYTLTVRAKTLEIGTGQVDVSFFSASGEAFRIFKGIVPSQTYSTITVDFTVPLYANNALVRLKPRNIGVPIKVDSVSLKQRAPISEIQPLGAIVDSYVPVNYTLAFNDEFNGTELDRRKWHTRMMYSGTTLDHLNDEKQRYTDNNVHPVSAGTLKLMARKVNTNVDGINYEAGMIRSDWCAYYGYYEARVKMAGGKGTWSAFWIDADVSSEGTTAWPPEIDFFEYVVNDGTQLRNMLNNNVHVAAGRKPIYETDPNYNAQYGFTTKPYNFNEGWHTIGCEWGPDFVKNYIDGVLTVHRFANWNGANPAKLAGPAHIILNLAIGGSWAGVNGIDDLVFPQALEVDWVRAYKKN
jgi:beta-glucanase (GH16 family)